MKLGKLRAIGAAMTVIALLALDTAAGAAKPAARSHLRDAAGLDRHLGDRGGSSSCVRRRRAARCEERRQDTGGS